MRELTGHKVNLINDRLKVTAVDVPGRGGANHEYEISGFDAPVTIRISFQDGPIAERGVNGITNEALLEILIDRLRGFQQGPYPGRENALALTKMEEAKFWLRERTRDRMDRGVEGTSQK